MVEKGKRMCVCLGQAREQPPSYKKEDRAKRTTSPSASFIPTWRHIVRTSPVSFFYPRVFTRDQPSYMRSRVYNRVVSCE